MATLSYPYSIEQFNPIKSVIYIVHTHSHIHEHIQTHEAWTHHFPTVRDHILGWLPSPLRQLLGYTLYRKVQSGLDGQGTGRLTDGEVGDARTEIWGGVASALAKNTNDLKMASGDVSDSDAPVWFFGGGGPSEVDAVLFAAVVSILVCEAYVKHLIFPFYLPLLFRLFAG